jgi:hypothetical protein
MVVLLAPLDLGFQLSVPVPNQIKLPVLPDQHIVQLLNFLAHDPEVLLVLNDLNVLLIGELNLMEVLLQLVGLLGHLVLQVVDDLLVVGQLAFERFVLELLVYQVVLQGTDLRDQLDQVLVVQSVLERLVAD